MSITAPNISLASELGLDNWDAVVAQLDGASPEPPATPTPSPAERAPVQAAPKGERAAVAADTGAEAGTATPKAADPPVATDASDPASRATYPKWWKGTEEEWQAARAESNRTANRERDRADKEAAARQTLEERLAYLESQIGVRDGSFADLAAQAYGDPQRAQLLLDADRQRGNDAYLTAKQQRDAEAVRAQAAADAAAESARTVEQSAEAVRKTLYADNLVLANEYADGRGVVGLKASDTLLAEFAKPANARLLAISQDASVSAEAAEAATAEIYERAHASWRALVDAASVAKAGATQGEDETSKGRKTALGTNSSPTGNLDEWTPEAATRALTDYYAEQDRTTGGHYRAPRGDRQAAST